MPVSDPNRSFVLVTGATGAVGPRVVTALLEAGHRVRTLSLDAPLHDEWPEGVDERLGDITDPEAVAAAMAGVEGVVHLAALLHIVNPPPELKPRYERINVGGTATVVEAACRANVERLVFFSTIAVYGSSDGAVITEESPLQPDSFYAQTKVEAERIVLSAKRADGKPLGTVLRLGAVYGTRIKGNYRRLLLSLARGRFIPIGAGTNRRTLVYDKDAARAAVLALRHPDCAGEAFNITDGRFHEMNTIIETLCGALGRLKPGWSVPVGPVRFLAGIIEDAGRLLGRTAPIVRATIDKYTEDVAVDGSRFQTRTGFSPKYDLAAGWRETVAEMKQTGEL
ncbi:MAG TPA: NAD-dependent epimerase/dehydratase family protein [Smithellaceae bacterium]|nr:NAD-dependent epimerase/dehydratase family protein [Smithellaceae bacterium]HOG81967.1 NAD-dependent epimerase/dehydratase family protein [Smithellaceae bacterium]